MRSTQQLVVEEVELTSASAICKFTAVVYSGDDDERRSRMRGKKVGGRSAKTQSRPWVRASISFPPDLYETLEELAKQKKVSLAWVVRDASEKYVADQSSLSGKH